jgi:hypothetical protein
VAVAVAVAVVAMRLEVVLMATPSPARGPLPALGRVPRRSCTRLVDLTGMMQTGMASKLRPTRA